MRWAVRLALATTVCSVTACGRVSFDPLSGDATVDRDGQADTTSADTSSDTTTSAITMTTKGSDNNVSTMLSFFVALAPGDTLIVATNRRTSDISTVTWNGLSLNQDFASTGWGSGPVYTTIWSLYTASGGSAAVIATGAGANSGEMIVNVATGLLPSAVLDQGISAVGNGTSASAGPSNQTQAPRELVYGVIAGDSNTPFGGTFSGNWTQGLPVVGVNEQTIDAYMLVTQTGSFSITYGPFANQGWYAAIATYKAP